MNFKLRLNHNWVLFLLTLPLAVVLSLHITGTKPVKVYAQPVAEDPVQCIARTTGEFMEQVAGSASSMRYVKFLSPAFNITSPVVQDMVNGISSQPSWSNGDIYAIAANSYDIVGGPNLVDFVRNFRALPDVGATKRMILTETGYYPPAQKDANRVTLLGQHLAVLKDPSYRVEASLLFNAFGLKCAGDPSCDFFGHILTDTEVNEVCGAACSVPTPPNSWGNIGVNGADEIQTNANSILYSKAQQFGMRYVLQIAHYGLPTSADPGEVDSFNQTLAAINLMHSRNIIPIIRFGFATPPDEDGIVWGETWGFDDASIRRPDPQKFIDFLTAIDTRVNKPVYAIAGPNEPETDCWASRDCVGCGDGELLKDPRLCEISIPSWRNNPKNEFVVRGLIKGAKPKTIDDAGRVYGGNQPINGVVVKAYTGEWINPTGKTDGGQICDNECVPVDKKGMCGVSGRKQGDSVGLLGCEDTSDDYEEGANPGSADGQYQLTVFNSRHNFDRSAYVAFYCNGNLNSLYKVGLAGADKDSKNRTVINLDVTISCDYNMSLTAPTPAPDCVNYVDRSTYLMCTDFNSGWVEPTTQVLMKESESRIAALVPGLDTKPGGGFDLLSPRPTSCNPGAADWWACPVAVNTNPADSNTGADPSLTDLEVWTKTTNSFDPKAISKTMAATAGNPYCGDVAGLSYSAEAENRLPLCENIRLQNMPISSGTPNVNAKTCQSIVANTLPRFCMLKDGITVDNCWHAIYEQNITDPDMPVCCPATNPTCSPETAVKIREIQPPWDLEPAAGTYAWPVSYFPYPLVFSGSNVPHVAANQSATEVTNDSMVRKPEFTILDDAAAKQAPFSANTDESKKHFAIQYFANIPKGPMGITSYNVIDRNTYDYYSPFKTTPMGMLRLPNEEFGVQYDANTGLGTPTAAAKLPKYGRGVYGMVKDGLLQTPLCTSNKFDTESTEPFGDINLSVYNKQGTNAEWVAGGKFKADEHSSANTPATLFKTSGINFNVFDILGEFIRGLLATFGFQANQWPNPCPDTNPDCVPHVDNTACLDVGGYRWTGAVGCNSSTYCPNNAPTPPAGCDISGCEHVRGDDSYQSGQAGCGDVKYTVINQYMTPEYEKGTPACAAFIQLSKQLGPVDFYSGKAGIGDIRNKDDAVESEQTPGSGFGADDPAGCGPQQAANASDFITNFMGDPKMGLIHSDL